jgi:hypothetical protein
MTKYLYILSFVLVALKLIGLIVITWGAALAPAGVGLAIELVFLVIYVLVASR